MDSVHPDEEYARALDESDPLREYRDRFLIPERPDGTPFAYFAGNSLGLQPKGARAVVEQELEDWSKLAVDGHFRGKSPWFRYHEQFRAPLARLVGGRPSEVVAMNSLTVNLHLLMVSFYRPTAARYKILMEYPAFPSDIYALETQLRVHGHDPDDGLVVVRVREGEDHVRLGDVESTLAERGHEIALVMLGGVNYFSGQLLDIQKITELAQARGCCVGWDLAHAVGNVPLALHDWNVDFAAWCSYKYLNGGPGAVAGSFIHERHVVDRELPRLGGWWGNDPETRFRLHLESRFVPVQTADAWQISNPCILAMAPLRASLEIFDEVGMEALREKSKKLTQYLARVMAEVGGDHVEVITPQDPEQRGCQLSLRVRHSSRERFELLRDSGVVADYRQPDVFRVAPAPLYNSYHDVWRLAQAVRQW